MQKIPVIFKVDLGSYLAHCHPEAAFLISASPAASKPESSSILRNISEKFKIVETSKQKTMKIRWNFCMNLSTKRNFSIKRGNAVNHNDEKLHNSTQSTMFMNTKAYQGVFFSHLSPWFSSSKTETKKISLHLVVERLIDGLLAGLDVGSRSCHGPAGRSGSSRNHHVFCDPMAKGSKAIQNR